MSHLQFYHAILSRNFIARQSRMFLSIGRLYTWQKLMTLKQRNKLVTNKLFDNLGHESKVGHWPIVLHIRYIRSCLLKPKPWSNYMYSMALIERKTTLL